MSGLNPPRMSAKSGSPGTLRTESNSSSKTHEGAAGYVRDDRTQLFLLTTTTFAGEGSYYEDAAVSDSRLRELTHRIASESGGRGWHWISGFLPWLRREGIRTSSLICAVEAGRMRPADARGMTRRKLIDRVQLRADEPGELLAYAYSAFGRSVPIWLKRGIADGATRLYDERAVLRWDKTERAVRFADVIEFCHVPPQSVRPEDPAATSYGERMLAECRRAREGEAEFRETWMLRRTAEIKRREMQNALFTHLITERKGRSLGLDGEPYIVPGSLRALRARWEANQLEPDDRHILAAAGGEELELAMAGQWEWLRSWLGER